MGTTGSGSRYRSRPVVAALTAAHCLEIIGLLCGATVVATLARTHPGRGAGVPALILLVAAAAVGWQAIRLLAGRPLAG